MNTFNLIRKENNSNTEIAIIKNVSYMKAYDLLCRIEAHNQELEKEYINKYSYNIKSNQQ